MALFTPKALLSYPHLDVAQKDEKGKERFSGTLIFLPETLKDPKEKAFLDAMNAALVEAGREKFGSKFDQLIQSEGFKKGFRRDAAAKGYPEGSIFINVRSTKQPGLVYPYAEPGTNPPKPAKVPQEKIKEVFYPGAIVRASVSAFAFIHPEGGKGVSFGLNNLQFLGNGPRLDNRVAAEDEFDVDMTAEPADLASFLG